MSDVARRLEGLFPDGQVLEGFRAEPWAVCDRVPAAVVFPENEEQVAEILTVANQEGWSCAPAGKATWLGGGHPPRGIDIAVSLTRMDHVLEYEPADLTVTAEAGVGMDLLGRRTRSHRQWVPLDAPGPRRGTLGATLATASAGPLQAGYGLPRDHVLGARMVTGDGRILNLGGKVVKNVAGFDLLKAIVGSWGTLGIITSATMRLHPVPAVDRTLLFTGAERDPLVTLAMRIAQAPLPIAALEVLVPGERETGSTVTVLAVRVLGTREEVEAVTEGLLPLAGAVKAQLLEGEASAALFENIELVEEDATLVLRFAALPDRLPRLVDLADQMRPLAHSEEGWGVRFAGHVTAGTLRVMIDSLDRSPGWMEAASRLIHGARGQVEAEGGTLVVSRGPPELVGEVGAWGDPGPLARLMRGMKDSFDPEGVLAPGRMGVI